MGGLAMCQIIDSWQPDARQAVGKVYGQDWIA